MNTVQDLMQILGLTEGQVRIRLDTFRPVLGQHLKKGSFNKILVDNSGLEILKRAKQLEENGLQLEDVLKQLQAELGESHGNSQGLTDLNSLNLRLETLQIQLEAKEQLLQERQREIQDKNAEIQFLRDRIKALEAIIHNRLPPPQDEIREKLAQKVSRWERFRQLLRGV